LEAEKQPGKLDSAHSSLRFTEEKLLRELCWKRRKLTVPGLLPKRTD
jgi:hypothetical protein